MKHFLPLILLFTTTSGLADDADRKEKKKEDEKKSFAEIVEKRDLEGGLFNIDQDREDGTVYLAIGNDHLNQEYTHFSYVLDGIPALGLFRGNFLQDYERSIQTLTRHIGGVRIDRSVHGQAGAAKAPLTPVPAADQKRAAETLRQFAFSPDTFDFASADLVSQLQLQRRGFDFFDLEANEAPKIQSFLLEKRPPEASTTPHMAHLRRLVSNALQGR